MAQNVRMDPGHSGICASGLDLLIAGLEKQTCSARAEGREFSGLVRPLSKAMKKLGHILWSS